MKNWIFGFLAGVGFATGLAVSGMSQPSKVRGFLDFFGEWDPTLLFVLGPAVGIYFGGMQFLKRKQRGEGRLSPEPEKMGLRFVLGSLAFGAGWGLVGLCPGPALVALGGGERGVLLFVATMLLAIWVADRGLARFAR